ncbi:MAG: ABC transporter permease [Bryobacterales bacterium]|nr:ABC transporter permease [Bryobacterales bacterium]
MDKLMQDLRYGLRGVRRAPGYAAIVVATLALGIGANTAMFSVVRHVLLSPLGYRDAGQLVTLLHGAQGSPVAPANFFDLQAQTRGSFSAMGAASAAGVTVAVGEPERLVALRMSEEMFPLLGVAPLLGRTPAPEEHRAGRDKVAVLSHRLWQRRFGGDAGVVGRSYLLDGQPHRILGVMPEHFQFAPFWVTEAEIWLPLVLEGSREQRGAQFLRVFGRMRAGVGIETARAEAGAVWARLAAAYPEANAGLTLQVDSLEEKVVGSVRHSLWLLMGAVGFVLLVACTNVANLALARAASRQKEVAIRLALGAGRGRLMRQLLVESVLLSAVGGVLGVLLARWGVAWFKTSALLPRMQDIEVDAPVMLFSAGLALLTGVLSGLLPAWRASRGDVQTALRERARGGSAGQGQARTRAALVVAEIAMSFLLLAGAGLLLRTFVAMRQVDPGFAARGLQTMQVSLDAQRELRGESRTALYREMLARVREVPGVESASMVNHLPVGGDLWGGTLLAEGMAIPQPGRMPRAVWRVAMPGYFAAMRARWVAGRDFTDADREGTAPVVIVNEKLARRLWPAGDALGRRVRLGDPRVQSPWVTVIGVVRDLRQRSWTAPVEEEYYLPVTQGPEMASRSMTVVVRGEAAMAELVRSAVRGVSAAVPVSEVKAMEDIVGRAMWREQFYSAVLSGFAGFALLLAAIGLYGVVAQAVAQRTGEIGIRMAVGATRGQVMGMVLGQAARLTAVGLAIGLAMSLAGVPVLRSLLFGVEPYDGVTFGGIAVLLVVVALAAAMVPAWRAGRMDPLAALRRE